MNKQILINDVAKKVPYLRKQDVKLVLTEAFEILEETLKSGERITLSGFGSWTTKLSNKRKARNPKTGEEIIVEPKLHVKWNTAQKFKEALNAK